MIPIYRIDHVSQVVADLTPLSKLYEGLFGFVPVREWESPAEGCRGKLYELPRSSGQRWELLEPHGNDSPLQDFLDSPSGPGIHHVAIETSDMEKALGELDRLGITTVHASRDGREHWIEFPLAPPAQGDAHGLHVRLFASPDYEVCGDNRGTSKNTLRAQKVPREIGEGHNTLALRELVHLCQATRSLDALASWNEGLFGMQPLYRTPDGKHPDMATMMLTLPGSGIIWELIAPVGEDSFIDRFLDKRGEAGCHHVTFEVQSWEGAMAACEVHGVPVFGESSGTTDGANWRDAFIHPKHSGGALIQLYWEERPGVWMRSDKISADRKAAWR